VQLGVALVALGAWRLGELAAARIGGRRLEAGGRGRGAREAVLQAAGTVAAVLATGPVLMGLAGLALWSVAGLWPFPAVLPDTLALRTWAAALPGLGDPVRTSLVVGAAAVAISLALVLASLEAGLRHGRGAGARVMWLLYLPLIVPQVAFLFGLQTLAVAARLDAQLGGVILAHVVFVLPYVYLSLAEPWRALDPRYAAVGASLGAGADRLFWMVRLPLLLAPVLTAAAVGFAVSIGLYLPTLLVGGGRVATLTTEAVALAAGGDRRLIGLYGLAQMLAPMAGFALALAVPALVWRRRRALRARP